MPDALKKILEKEPVRAEAPCRVDMGGTVDMPALHYAIRSMDTLTFNIAVGMRTKITLLPHKAGFVKVSSTGFDSAEYPEDKAPFIGHPLGLMFAVAAFFRASGVHITVESGSPVRSALGGSSAAVVALVAAFSKAYERLGERALSIRQVVLLSHGIESNTAGVPCGLQDQLAAAYGGVNAWYWHPTASGPGYDKRSVISPKDYAAFNERLLLAYCGSPHDSIDVNSVWVREFLRGATRDKWITMCRHAVDFVEALARKDYASAAAFMNKEVAIRREMTPNVLTPIMEKLVDTAVENGCGGRFTGAGAGGCVWALGEKGALAKVRVEWDEILSSAETARLLPITVDGQGVLVD